MARGQPAASLELGAEEGRAEEAGHGVVGVVLQHDLGLLDEVLGSDAQVLVDLQSGQQMQTHA